MELFVRTKLLPMVSVPSTKSFPPLVTNSEFPLLDVPMVSELPLAVRPSVNEPLPLMTSEPKELEDAPTLHASAATVPLVTNSVATQVMIAGFVDMESAMRSWELAVFGLEAASIPLAR